MFFTALPLFVFCVSFNAVAQGAQLIPGETIADKGAFTFQEDKDLQMKEDSFVDLEEEITTIYDPIEPFNRAMFHFNDRLYFWVLKPAAQGYSRIVPEKARIGVRRFFSNITTPIRFVNAVIQFKFKKAGIEISRFLINTTLGVAGFMDPARERWRLFKHEEDTGQTLGFYGTGPGVYINWPVFGPSNVRDTMGWVGDFFLDPTSYLFPHDRLGVMGIWAYNRTNETSLEIGQYEALKEKTFDPYIALRDAYHQHRESAIKE